MTNRMASAIFCVFLVLSVLVGMEPSDYEVSGWDRRKPQFPSSFQSYLGRTESCCGFRSCFRQYSAKLTTTSLSFDLSEHTTRTTDTVTPFMPHEYIRRKTRQDGRGSKTYDTGLSVSPILNDSRPRQSCNLTAEQRICQRTAVTAFTLSLLEASFPHRPACLVHPDCRRWSLQTGDAESLNRTATVSAMRLNSLLFRFSWMAEVSETLMLFHCLCLHQRTKGAFGLVETTNKVIFCANESLIRLFRVYRNQLLCILGELSPNTKNLLTDRRFALLSKRVFRSGKHIKDNISLKRVMNNIGMYIHVLVTPKMLPSHFISTHCKYAINILCFLVTFLYFRTFLYDWDEEKLDMKVSENGILVGDVWSCLGWDKVKYRPNGDDSYCRKSSPGYKADVLYDIIHHPWRQGLRRMVNVDPPTSLPSQQRGNHSCLSSSSTTLCPDCQQSLQSSCFHRRETPEHTDTTPKSNTPVTFSARAALPSQSIIYAYPVTRFLPDPTRDPSQNLAHVGYRLATLSALPASVLVSRIRLADAGFYSRGVNDEVTCHSCHVQHSGWTGDDNPLEVHRRLSPDCAHVRQCDEMSTRATSAREPAAAAPPGGSGGASSRDHSHEARNSVPANSNLQNGWHTSIPCTTASTETSGPETQYSDHESTSSARASGNDSSATANRSVNIPTTVRTSTSSARSRTESRTNSGTPPASSVSNSLPGDRSGDVEHIPADPAGRHPGTRSLPAEGTGPGTALGAGVPITTLSGSSVVLATDAERQSSMSRENPPRCLFPRARLDLGGAVYPMYQDMASRRRSFNNWDETRAPPLNDILLSGMFYAGYSDCVRCFYCGVGLKRWVVTDNVWDEHVRWRPECRYLRAVKGDNFIRNTQRRLGTSASESAEEPHRPPTTATAPSRQRPTTTTTTTATATATAAAAASASRPATSATATATPRGQTTASVTQTPGNGARQPAARTASAATSQGHQPGTSPRGSESRAGDRPAAAAVPARDGGSPPGWGCSSSSRGGSNTSDGQDSAQRQGADGTVVTSASDEQQALARLQAENRTLARSLQCMVCHRAPVDTIILPCAHLVLCETCAGTVTSCPHCSEPIRATARVYMS